MPLGDWQFWVVTAIAGAGAWLVYRTLRPKRHRPRRTLLTIEGRLPGARGRSESRPRDDRPHG